MCSHGALRDKFDAKRDVALRVMAKGGMVNCTRSRGRASFHQLTHSCERFAALGEEVAQARVAWARKEGLMA